MPLEHLSAQQAEQLALELTHEAPSGARHAAFVAHAGRVWFARHAPLGAEPLSALVKLVQGVYETEPDQALFILRNRIHLTYEPTEMCWGMTKVAARRLAASVPARDHGLVLQGERRELQGLGPKSRAAQDGCVDPRTLWPEASPPLADADFMALAQRLAGTVPRDPIRRFDRDRAIAALIVSPEGELLSWGVNTITRNRTLHAELNAAQRYWRETGRPLPRGARVYVTLKPCRMCAGMLWRMTDEPRALRVFYSEFDPGPNARETVFNARGLDIERQI